MDAATKVQGALAKATVQRAGFAVLLVVSVLAGWHSLAVTFGLALSDDNYTYILLIAPISAAMIVLDWRLIRRMAAPGLVAGAALLAAAVLTALSAVVWSASLAPDVQLSIRMFALVLSWCGAFLFCFGYRAARVALFPICFAFALVPLPQVVMNEIIVLLQQGSAWSAHLLFAIGGVPVTQEGVILTIPGLTLKVAQECSSIRSSSMLLVTTLVLAQLLLRSPWRKALLIGVALPLSIAKNGLRIFSIAMLGTRVDRKYITGWFHHDGGIIWFAIALIVIFALLWILRRRDGVSESMQLQIKAVRG